jgi:zinc protease
MPLFRLIALLGACAFASVPVTAAPKETGPRTGRWAHEDSPLPVDRRVVWGRLENGLRYALLPHGGVPERVAMKLIVLSGSVDEKPNELGIAHFTEHMAFHGTREMNVAGMLSLFRRAGVEYGSDVNAVTTFDYTAYSLDFRDNNLGLLTDGIRWFRGIADGVLFEQHNIDRERRVIFAEKRNRDSLADRQLQASFPVMFKGLKFAQQSPIGTDQTLRALRREDFLEFYRRCYRPDLMVFVAAGDIDIPAMEKLVRDHFGRVAPAQGAVPPRDEGRGQLKEMRAGVFRIPGVGSAETTAASVNPQGLRSDTKEGAIAIQRRNFVMELFANRLRYMLPGVASPSADFNALLGFEAATASVRVPGPAWSQGVLGVDLAARETLRRGFEASELEPLRLRYLQLATHMAEQVPVMDPVELCRRLADSITGHTVYVGAETDFAWMREWLQNMSVAAANETFRAIWNPDALAFHVSGDIGMQLTAGEVLKTIQRHRRGELPFLLPNQPRDIPFTLKKPGKPSTVAERREVPELNADLMRLSNNVRLNFVQNRHEPGIVRAVVRVGTGLLNLPGNQPALKEFGLNTLLGSGTVYYQTDQLAQIIDRRFLEFGFDVSDYDAFTFRGAMAADNLETFLGLVAEILREPKFNSYAHRDERMRAGMARSAGAVGFSQGMRELMDHLFRGDARFMSGTPLDYISLGVADVRRWMDEPLSSGYVEATIVGDISEETARGVASRTLGTLRTRAEQKLLGDPKPVRVSAPAGFRRIEFVGELNVAMIVGSWPVETKLTIRDQAALNILTKVLELRVRGEVRENLGLSYGPSATFKPYGGFEDFSMLQATVDCTPADAEKVAKAVEQTAAKLAEEGVSAEEFEGASGIIRGQMKRAFHENEFLVHTLKRVQERPERIQEVIALKTGVLEEITPEDVNAWARKILPASNSRTAALVPKAFVGIFDTAKP